MSEEPTMTVQGLHPEIAADSPDLLRQVHGRRGYALSYHRMFQAHAPELLAAYDAYYQQLTLRPRALTAGAKETVWIALQAATREHHGMIHLKRAEAAGLGRDAIADALAIAAVVETWPVLQFGDDYWREWTPLVAALPRYLRMFEAAIGAVPAATAEITAIVCHAARRTHAGMRIHLPRAFAAGATPAMVAEGLSFLLLPAGGPCLIDAVQAWADAHAADPALPSPYGDAAEASS
jgi:alkylhydroperoxidase/carboxymuconolactone decarboxylase family protein YurZ